MRIKCQRNSAGRSNSPLLNLNADISICIYYNLLHSLTLTALLLQTLLQVVNHVTLVVAQNTVDYEALDLYTVNVS